MNILLVSQCKKNALKETRRLIDQFAERCGERTWQTVITQEGLSTLYKLLRKTARKNTAIACYWTHGKNTTELIWIIGDRSQFNDEGRVPTNRTNRNILRSDSENSWQYGSVIQIVATLAALLHDLGKSTVGFQNKLKLGILGDPYRHEWISLKLFILMIDGCDSHESVLNRLVHFDQYQQANPYWYQKLASVDKDRCNLAQAPSLVQWLAWLIVSHHRMPISQVDQSMNDSVRERQKGNIDYIENFTAERFFKELAAFSGWVFNPKSEHKYPEQFWQLSQSVTISKPWLNQLKRWAGKALNDINLKQLSQNDHTNNGFLLSLSRLALMTGDHNYSSQPKQHDCQFDGELIANTDRNKQAKQCLDEHLIGVAQYTARFAHLLPIIANHLPSLSKHKAFNERTKNRRFIWQNHSFDLAKQVNQNANEAGFFGVNMASTGCGKTLANARIMYGLADSVRGVRFTIALGLRVLTLQTGKALKDKLKLNDEQLAILVGGQANKALFELSDNPLLGSESEEELVDGFIDVAESAIEHAEFGTIIQDNKARSLLFSPLVSCTVDHLIQASETSRGGKYIVPTLRLLTADLILDEPDDFDQNDLPALARLVHLAGLYGSKVLLSSATLTPDLIAGLFNAYQAGRKIWQQQQNKPQLPIVCGWFDEFNQQIKEIPSGECFTQIHQQFVEQRAEQLRTMPTKRQGLIMPMLDYQRNKIENASLDFQLLANQIVQQAYQFHNAHHNIDPSSNKTVSVGLVRLAHTDNLIDLARAIYQLANVAENTELHIVVYHAKQLLLLRSKLEQTLDRLLDRSKPEQLFTHPEIRQALDNSKHQQHIFMVLGTPVTEVGRDHDYDWAIIEPSSMRSIIQLVGRVWRHRPDKVANAPNVAILASNLNQLKQANSGAKSACFYHPGFESKQFLLTTHNSSELIFAEQLNNINAIPRIIKPSSWQNKINSLAELEHRVMADLFNMPIATIGTKQRQANVVTSYWQKELAHPYCVHLQRLTPFRSQAGRQVEYVCQFNEYSPQELCFRLAEVAWRDPDELSNSTQNKAITYQSWQQIITQNDQIKPWLTTDFYQQLTELATYFPELTLNRLALQFATVTLQEESQWYYHPWFGFYRA